MVYDSETQFNENNITFYLAEVEEYFSTLITYNANKRGDANAAVSSVPLDILNEKIFDKKELTIDLPVEADLKTDKDGLSSVGGETTDEDVTNGKQLY